MKFTAEQLPLFEIEAEDSLAVYGTDSIPFLVVTLVTSPVTLTANVKEGTRTESAG